MRPSGALQLLVAFLFLGMGLHVEGGWIKAQQGSITVYSQLPKKQTRELLVELHQLKEGLRLMFPNLDQNMDLDLKKPIRLVFPDDKDTYISLLPLFLGKPKPASGMFSVGPLYNLLWVDGRRPREIFRATLFHEFVHAMLWEDQKIALAAEEGLAELISTVRFSEGKMILGEPVRERLWRLYVAPQMSISDLLKIDHDDTAYNHVEETTDFYDQSWLMMQFALCSTVPREERELFWRIVNHEQNQDGDVAFSRLLESGLLKLDEMKTAYLKAGNFEMHALDIRKLPLAPSWKFKRVRGKELKAVLAGAQLYAGRSKEASATLEKLLNRNPEHPFAYLESINLGLGGEDPAAVNRLLQQAQEYGMDREDLYSLVRMPTLQAGTSN